MTSLVIFMLGWISGLGGAVIGWSVVGWMKRRGERPCPEFHPARAERCTKTRGHESWHQDSLGFTWSTVPKHAKRAQT